MPLAGLRSHSGPRAGAPIPMRRKIPSYPAMPPIFIGEIVQSAFLPVMHRVSRWPGVLGHDLPPQFLIYCRPA
jgi:hypothetical protein